MVTTTEDWDVAAIAALIASATLLGDDLVVGLFTNDINPGKTVLLADLEEPSYGSYVRQSVTMGAPFRDPQRGIAALGDAIVWQQTGTPTPVTILGVFYAYGATLKLLGMERFDAPIPLNNLLDAFTTILEYVQSPPAASFSTIVQ